MNLEVTINQNNYYDVSVGIIYNSTLISYKNKSINGKLKFNIPKEYKNKNLILRVRNLFFIPYETTFKMINNTKINVNLIYDNNYGNNIEYNDYLLVQKQKIFENRTKKLERILK